MKKLLILTILITTYLQAEYVFTTNPDICDAVLLGKSGLIEKGIAPCKEGDLFVISPATLLEASNIKGMLKICKMGTIDYPNGICILEAEETWLKTIKH